jgi:hypothetical protein
MATPSYLSTLALRILCLINPKAESITLWDNTGTGDGNNFPYGWQPVAGGVNLTNPKKSEISVISFELTYKNGLSYIYTLSAGERTQYLDATQGVNLTPSKFGMTETNFPDGIVDIRVYMEGTTIGGDPSDWKAWNAVKEAFLTFLHNSIRNWSVSIPIPVKTLNDVFDQAMANLVLDNIYYSVQFGQEDSAQESMDFLIGLVTSGKTFSQYNQEHNI